MQSPVSPRLGTGASLPSRPVGHTKSQDQPRFKSGEKSAPLGRRSCKVMWSKVWILRGE